MTEQKVSKVLAWRKRFRVLFRILSVIGFFYQSFTFFDMYLKHPSTVELEVEQPTLVELPAVSVCNVNEIRSSFYCEKYPQNCESPESSSEFCISYPEYCHLVNNSNKMPMVGVETFLNLTRTEQQELGHAYKDLVSECKIEINGIDRNCSDPVLVAAMSFNQVPFNCYMLNSLNGKPSALPEEIPRSSKIYLALNLEVDEYHPSHLSRGAQLSIHSPYHVPSPKNEGFLLNLGRIYRMKVRLTDKKLLPFPFKSNCKDYFIPWKDNGGIGPMTEKMCKEKCKLEISLERFGCVDHRIDYPHNKSFCQHVVLDFLSSIAALCNKNCPSPCSIRNFEIEMDEADSEASRKTCFRNRTNDRSCITFVEISFESLEITTFTYNPRFEAIGIFSFIGGYVGLWLGISLLSVYDFLDSLIFHLCSNIRKKIRLKRKKRKRYHKSNSVVAFTQSTPSRPIR